jgi:hypothetical protein
MDFGLAALQRSVDESHQKGTGNTGTLNYFTWKDGDRKILRFLTNEVISADFAEWVLSNDGKTKDFLVHESKGDFVTALGGLTKDRKTGQLVPPKLRRLGVCIAVLREERPILDGSGRSEIVDAIVPVTVDNVNYQARQFGIVKQGMKNFWSMLLAVAGRADGICDRDYEITRRGGGLDTQYIISPVDPDERLRAIESVTGYYGYGRPWNDADPQRFLFCPKTLVEWADYYSSKERAEHWLLPKAPQAAAQPAGMPGFPPPGFPQQQTMMQPPPAYPQQPVPVYQPSPQGFAPPSAQDAFAALMAQQGAVPQPPMPQLVPQPPAPPQMPQQPPFVPTQPGQPAVMMPPAAPAGLPPLPGGLVQPVPPTSNPAGFAEFHPATTSNPAVPQGLPPLPGAGNPPSAYQMVQPDTTPQPPMPWQGRSEDEAQAAPSTATEFSALWGKLSGEVAQQQ